MRKSRGVDFKVQDDSKLDCVVVHDNNNNKDPPVRQSSELTVKALMTGYLVQPGGLDPDRAFNLALDKALERLGGLPVYRTDEQGVVEVITDGAQVWVETER